MAFSRVPILRQTPNTIFGHIISPYYPPTLYIPQIRRRFSVSATHVPIQPNLMAGSGAVSPNPMADSDTVPERKNRWRPLCLYYTQGKCAKMDDTSHLEMFNHNCSADLSVDAGMLKHVESQHLDFFLVLDLEGKVEILEFPVLMIDAKTLEVVDFFHRFVRPSRMTEQRINEYIEGKYGKLGVDRVWHDTAIPFQEVIQEFEVWMNRRQLLNKNADGPLRNAAFVTCGNWDLKTKVPQQCEVAKMKLPSYFMEWINLKDIYLNFYKRMAPGMKPMMRELQIPLVGSHHLGIDDTKNIARVLQRMLVDGAVPQITARRNPFTPNVVVYLFENRIRAPKRRPDDFTWQRKAYVRR